MALSQTEKRGVLVPKHDCNAEQIDFLLKAG